MTNHASRPFRNPFKARMRRPPMVQALMLELYVFRKRYRHPSLADAFSEHDLSFNMLCEASNHAFAETIMPGGSGIRRGVIYARVNGSQKRKIAHDLQWQMETLRKKMKRDRVEEVEGPIVEIASGLDFERKGLKRLLEIACARRIDCVYVCSLDRLGRHVIETPYFIHQLSLQGVVVRGIEGEHNSDDCIP